MKPINDFTILRRNREGFGTGLFTGTFEPKENCIVVARVMREDDNSVVIPWQLCNTQDKIWSVQFRIPQGGLYRLEARATAGPFQPTFNSYDWGDLVGLAHYVGVGEIYVMAGQSNMSAYGRDPAYDPPQLGVHLFNNEGKWVIASHPLNSAVNPIYANSDSASGTSPGLAFGKMMANRLGVPVGLVSAARGGTGIEDWNEAEEEHYLLDALIQKTDEVGPPSGMIWFQGCNQTCNEQEASSYLEKFMQTVTLWRKRWGSFPIVTCQINRHAWKGDSDDRYWGMVREAQRQAPRFMKDVFVVPTLDMYTTDGIHNGSGACVTVGERIARTMLHGVYGQYGSFAPNIQKITKISANQIWLQFEEDTEMRTMDDTAAGMDIEDEKGLISCTKAELYRHGVLVTAKREFSNNARFHAYWRRDLPPFFLRDPYGMPMLACYGVPIEE